MDFDHVGEVGEEQRQLLAGQQALLPHPLVEEEVEDPQDAEVRPFRGKELCARGRWVWGRPLEPPRGGDGGGRPPAPYR